MKKTILTAALVLAASACSSLYCGAEIKWLETAYDFGTIKEAAGPVTGHARFVNIGPGPTYIKNVRTTCGCTDASFTEGVIEEGDTATVSFTYDPEGRPGRFDKSVKAFVGEDNKMHVIKIRGTVIGAPETLDLTFPKEIGVLRMSQDVIPGGTIRHGEARHWFVTLYNQSDKEIRPTAKCDDEAVTLRFAEETVPPGEVGTLGVYLNSRDEKRMGDLEYEVELCSDADAMISDKGTLTLRCRIEPNLQAVGVEDLAKAAAIEVLPQNIDLGVVKGKKPLRAKATIRNAGNKDAAVLNVMRVYDKQGLAKAARYPARLQPGNKGELELTVDLSTVPAGPFRIPVEIISNDPLHPSVVVNVVGEKE